MALLSMIYTSFQFITALNNYIALYYITSLPIRSENLYQFQFPVELESLRFCDLCFKYFWWTNMNRVDTILGLLATLLSRLITPVDVKNGPNACNQYGDNYPQNQ